MAQLKRWCLVPGVCAPLDDAQSLCCQGLLHSALELLQKLEEELRQSRPEVAAEVLHETAAPAAAAAAKRAAQEVGREAGVCGLVAMRRETCT